MKLSVAGKFNKDTAAFDWQRTMNATSFEEFDDAITAPLHGFAGADQYYDRCSARRFLPGIRLPTLIINSLDDPFMTPAAVPAENTLPPAVQLELSNAGGHVGFIDGGLPWRPTFYLPARITTFLDSRIGVSQT
jgi:predicted alpha/beta-fold hydrolase